MKSIEKSKKQIVVYILVYIVILIFCGIFQFLTDCNAKYASCSFSTDRLNTLITTISVVITPIIAILGFNAWRETENYKNSHNLINTMLDITRSIQKKWHLSREYGDYSLFVEYYTDRKIIANSYDIDKFFDRTFDKIQSIFEEFNELGHIYTKLTISQKNKLEDLQEAIGEAETQLKISYDELWKFRNTLMTNQNLELINLSETEMYKFCQKFDRYCNQIMGNRGSKENIDYSKLIDKYISNISSIIQDTAQTL